MLIASLKNGITFVVAVIFSLFLGEAAVRVAYRGNLERSDYSDSVNLTSYTAYDDVLGWKLKPNAVGKVVTSEYETEIQINARGYRGPEVSYEKPDGEVRVVILGDSFAEGYSVSYEDRFSSALERKLNSVSRDDSVRVINLGVGGYSSDQELLLFEREGIKYSPDFVLLFVYDNDIFYNSQDKYWRGGKPVFEIVGEQLITRNTPVPIKIRVGKAPSESENARKETWGQNSISLWLHQNSSLYLLIRRSIINNHWLLAFFVKIGLADDKLLTAIPGEFRVYARKHDDSMSRAWRVTSRIIRRLDERVKKLMSKMFVVYVPSSAAVYPEDWRATRWRYGMADEEWDVDRVRNEISSICEKGGIGFLDLTSPLQVAARVLETEGKRVYYREDGHWTPEGNAVVGEVLFQFLADRL